ncbi:MAG: class I SAM-dependent methyltransferase [Solirubrobacteraceae bacterium]
MDGLVVWEEWTPPARVADMGCGTGTLAVLLAQQGYQVTGIDLAPKMIQHARRKARLAAVDVDFTLGDASDPPLAPGSFDVVLARHVLWALPDPASGLARWISLLRSDGRLVMIEGRWSTGVGLPAADLLSLVSAQGRLQT